MQENNHISQQLLEQNKMLIQMMEMLSKMQIENSNLKSMVLDINAKVSNIHRVFDLADSIKVEKPIKKLTPLQEKKQRQEERKSKEKIRMMQEIMQELNQN